MTFYLLFDIVPTTWMEAQISQNSHILNWFKSYARQPFSRFNNFIHQKYNCVITVSIQIVSYKLLNTKLSASSICYHYDFVAFSPKIIPPKMLIFSSDVAFLNPIYTTCYIQLFAYFLLRFVHKDTKKVIHNEI